MPIRCPVKEELTKATSRRENRRAVGGAGPFFLSEPIRFAPFLGPFATALRIDRASRMNWKLRPPEEQVPRQRGTMAKAIQIGALFAGLPFAFAQGKKKALPPGIDVNGQQCVGQRQDAGLKARRYKGKASPRGDGVSDMETTGAHREIGVPRVMRGARPGKPGRQTAGASSRTPHETQCGAGEKAAEW